MRSDAKLGLAMAILVTGFAIAFCFPRQQLQAPTTLTEVDPLESSEIDFRPIREQLSERSFAESQLAVPSPVDYAVVTQLASDAETTDRTEADLSLERSSIGLAELLNQQNSQDASQVDSPPIVKDHSATTNTYVVKSGDTLSEIATKTLGRSSRFLEIYEANRDLLNSPDDLKPGLKLTIPGMVADLLTEAVHNRFPSGAPDQPETQEQSVSVSQMSTHLPLNEIKKARPKSHTLQAGETLHGVALRYYDTPGAAERILQANPALSRSNLKPGDVLHLP